ncbi:MAG: hypothetical protein EZS28_019381, partial [Streblomastix strix]
YTFAIKLVSIRYRANRWWKTVRAKRNYINVFASDNEVTVTDVDAGPALRTPPMQETQFFIMTFLEYLTGLNAFAIDFWANPMSLAQIQDYKARTLHSPELTKLSIQHVLEGNTKETLIDLVGMCAALLRFAENHVICNSNIACVETDVKTGKSRLSQSASRPTLRNCNGTGITDSAAGDVYTNTDLTTILFRTADTKTIGIIAIPGIRNVPGNTTILEFSVSRSFLTSPTFFRLWHVIIRIAKHH